MTGRQSAHAETVLLQDGALQSTPRRTQQAGTRGLHRQHGSSGRTGSTLDRSVDEKRRMRDPGQLRLTLGNVPNDRTLDSLVASSLGLGDTESSESAIAVQSELWRLRVVFSDRSLARQEHERVFESVRQARLRAQRSQSWTDAEDLDRTREGLETKFSV